MQTASAKLHSKPSKVKVLIVDDSPVIRKVLRHIFAREPGIQVVGEADSAAAAVPVIEQNCPDVVTLDIEMPGMDGISFFRQFLLPRRLPTVLITSLNLSQVEKALAALDEGVVDYMQKPKFGEIEEAGAEICAKVLAAAQAKLPPNAASRKPVRKISVLGKVQPELIVIGASTGGTQALSQILTGLPDQIPPILIVQHIPPYFSKVFAGRLDQLCAFSVKEAAEGDVIRENQVLIAPGGLHLGIVDIRGELRVRLSDVAPVNRHRPSIDYLFFQVPALKLRRVTGVLLTGMGADGAEGLLRLQTSGALTIAQDEATSTVFGMPKEAIALGAADYVCALQDVGLRMLCWETRRKLQLAATQ